MSFVKLVEVWRGPLVESVHVGAAAVANAAGEIVAGWGDIKIVTYPRSALKPVQAIALVETGAYETHALSTRHLALACASHRGEPFHTELAAAWLARIGLDQNALRIDGRSGWRDRHRGIRAVRDLWSRGGPRATGPDREHETHERSITPAPHRPASDTGANEKFRNLFTGLLSASR